ncbi:MAG TPA: response regulator transcription factor [Usitatibacter sp.]|nr:response regulator transcription factor [Usitatibacter sp.]
MKILLVDDHHLIRDGMRPVLERLATGEPVEVFEAETFEAAVETASRHDDLDLVLLDLRLPGVTHFEALEGLRERFPALPIVLMSGDDEPDLVRGALERGALGYIPKSSNSEVLLNAIRLVLSGGTYLPPEAIGRQPRGAAPAASSAEDIAARLAITPRQADVLALLLAGKSNKLISRELNLAESTVKNHIAAVFRALDVTTRVQAVLAASKLGIKT